MPIRSFAGHHWFCFEEAPAAALAVSSTRDVLPDSAHRFAPDAAARAGIGIALDRIAWCRQVHGDGIVASTTPGEQGEGDALVTDRAGLVLSIRTADCLPVFLVDPIRRVSGLVHAGWRGVAAGIVPHTVDALVRLYGVRPGTLWAGIGPGICARHFEVGADVAALFSDAHVARGGAKPHVDLVGVVCEQLAGAGVRKVSRSNACTFEETDRYPSYRREQTDARLFSLLSLPASSTRS